MPVYLTALLMWQLSLICITNSNNSEQMEQNQMSRDQMLFFFNLFHLVSLVLLLAHSIVYPLCRVVR